MTCRRSDPSTRQASGGHADGGLRTLERGLRVLELLAASPAGLSFSEVGEGVGLTTGTVNRLLQTLVGRGYVEQDKRSRTYRLGLQVLELQASSLASNRMAAEARPHLRGLMLRTGRRVHLAVHRGGDHLIHIDRVDNQESLGRFVPVGRGGPLHATSLGKAILAFKPADEVTDYLVRSKREQLTQQTITGANELREVLQGVRRLGFATESEESAPGIYCVGAPIFDYTGSVVAAVSVAGTRDEIVHEIPSLSEAVMDAASSISESFGYRRVAG